MYRFILNNITKFINKHNKIPYHLQWENRDFKAKIPVLKIIERFDSPTLTKYGNTCNNIIPYNKQWEIKDFYKKYEK